MNKKAVVWLSTGLIVSLIALALESHESRKWERASQQWHDHSLKLYEAYRNETQQAQNWYEHYSNCVIRTEHHNAMHLKPWFHLELWSDGKNIHLELRSDEGKILDIINPIGSIVLEGTNAVFYQTIKEKGQP